MKAKIVSNESEHEFKIGTVVECTFNPADGDYLCVDVDNSLNEWWVAEEDLEVIEE